MIAKFALFDLLNFLTPVKRVAPALFLVLVAPAIAPSPAFGIVAAAIVMSLLASNPFAADERGRLDTLYATLPMTRSSVVIGRYVALVVLYLAVAVLGTAATIVVLIKNESTVDYGQLGVVNVISLLIFTVVIAVQLPFFFSVGFTRARLMAFIPMAVLVGGTALASQLGFLSRFDLMGEISRNLNSLWIGAPVVVVLALAVSITVSAIRYGRRAL